MFGVFLYLYCMKLKINGLKELLREIDRIDREAPKEVELELKKIADDILNQAISRVPVKSGQVKGSAFIEKIEGGWVIGFSAKIAPYIEFGTGAFVEIPLGLEKEAMQFFVTGEGKGRAHPYLFPVFLARKEGIVNELSTAISNYLKQF